MMSYLQISQRDLARDMVNEIIPAKRAALALSRQALADGAPDGFVLSCPEPDVWFLETGMPPHYDYAIRPNKGALMDALHFDTEQQAGAVRDAYHASLDGPDLDAMSVEVVSCREGLERHIRFLERRIAEEITFAIQAGVLNSDGQIISQGEAPMWVVQEFPDSHRVMRTHENGKPVETPTEVARFERTTLGLEQAKTYLRELIDKRAEIDEVLNV